MTIYITPFPLSTPEIVVPPPFMPIVRPEIFALRPDYCALSLVAEGVRNHATHPASERWVASATAPAAWPAWGDAHVDAWRAAYRAFGAKPQRTPSSVDALTQRMRRDGALPAISAVVDLYNAISVAFAVPIGGENVAAYASSPTLRYTNGDETFDTVRDGAPCLEPVPAGEIVWADTQGVTCRRWNWRQGTRTRVNLDTTHMWFVLERLEPMPMPALLEAGRLLAAALRMLSPEAKIESTLIDRGSAAPAPDAIRATGPVRANAAPAP